MTSVTNGQRMTLQAVYALLARCGLQRRTIDSIRESLIYDAIVEGKDLQFDRIYTGIAIMLHEEFGFGATRIVRGLKKFDEKCGSVLVKDADGNDVANWTMLMEKLKNETGLVIHTGDDNRLICEHGEIKK